MNIKKAFDLEFYPNPAKQFLDVIYQATEKAKIEIRLINQSGQVIKTLSKTVYEGINKFRIGMEGILSGTYQIQLVSKDNISITRKFIKE